MSKRKTAKAPAGKMTIGELARRTGMTIRNIRAHQTRGLLPPPTVRGRTGYYGEEHVARIELTREMQADGLNLEAIRRVLDSGDGSASAIFDFTRALRAPFEDEAPEIVDPEELARIWGEAADARLTHRAEKLGIFRTLPDGRVEVISPQLLRAAAELAALGIGAEGALVTAEKLRRQADGVARAFVDLFDVPAGGELLGVEDFRRLILERRPHRAGEVDDLLRGAAGALEDAADRLEVEALGLHFAGQLDPRDVVLVVVAGATAHGGRRQ